MDQPQLAQTHYVPQHSPGDRSTGARNRSFGARGEQLACDYLRSIGCRVLDRNWRAGRLGELDLVVQDGSTVVAVEVKTRSGASYGSPFEAITVRKAARLRELLHLWVREHRPGCAGLRIDAIGITIRRAEAPFIEHLRGIS